MRVRRVQLTIAISAVVVALLSARPAPAQSALPAKGAKAPAGGAPAGSVRIVKPRARVVSGAACLVKGDTFGATWGPSALPALAFTIGPGSVMADQLHANKAPYTGPGRYANVIIAVYMGKTALEDSYMGLGTITVNADGKSGTFALNDGSASGSWDCGHAPQR
ncbi:MAG TPA: hypothetical protein VFJ96_02925 [Gemmatimonadaceae bacterium]|nr:hypothetical protein [Gemmatimonadaceae bacterium]